MKLSIYFLFLSYICCMQFIGYAQQWQIVKHMGGPGNDEALVIVNDINGNKYVGGEYRGTAIFDSDTINCLGVSDYFIAKYNNNNELDWIKYGGGTGTDIQHGDAISDIKLSVFNDLFITGTFNGTSYFGNSGLTCTGIDNAFVARYDTNGNCVWAKKIGGTGLDSGMKIVLDDDNNIYVSGLSTSGTLQADNITLSMSDHIYFLAKLDINGNFKWLKSITGPGWFYPNDMKCISNNIYICGAFNGNISIGSVSFVTNNDFLPCLIKIDTSGSGIWGRQLYCQNYGSFSAFEISQNESFYLIGYNNGNLIINNDTIRENGGFIVKIDNVGNLIWVKKMGLEPSSILSTSNETIITSGTFSGSSTFSDCTITAPNSNTQMFIAKINSSGDCLGVTSVDDVPRVNYLSLDSQDQLYVAGYCMETTFGNIPVGNYGNADAFWAKLDYVSGFEENKPGNNTLYIYANPNTGTFNVEVPELVMNEREVILKIFDNNNRLVKQQTLNMSEETLHMDVEDSAPGLYYLQLISKHRVYQGKMVVQ